MGQMIYNVYAETIIEIIGYIHMLKLKIGLFVGLNMSSVDYACGFPNNCSI